MRRMSILLLLILGVTPLLITYTEITGVSLLLGMPKMYWLWGGVIFFLVGSIMAIAVSTFRQQADENPYYADMVRAKREEVHKMQAVFKESIDPIRKSA